MVSEELNGAEPLCALSTLVPQIIIIIIITYAVEKAYIDYIICKGFWKRCVVATYLHHTLVGVKFAKLFFNLLHSLLHALLLSQQALLRGEKKTQKEKF